MKSILFFSVISIFVSCHLNRLTNHAESSIIVFNDSNNNYSLNSHLIKKTSYAENSIFIKLDSSFSCVFYATVYDSERHSYDGSHPQVTDTIMQIYTYEKVNFTNSIDHELDTKSNQFYKLSDLTFVDFSSDSILNTSVALK